MDRVLGVLDKVLTFIEEWILFIATMAALLALFANVALRYLFQYALAWSEELVREVIIITTFLGCSTAVKLGTMIRIDALYQVKPKLKAPLTTFSNLVTLFYACFLTFYGYKVMLVQAQTNQKTIIMQIPLEYLYAILPISGVFLGLRCIQVIYKDFKKK